MGPFFHLSISVSDLEASKKFYCNVMQGHLGRVQPDWADVWLFGAQITLYQRGEAIPPENIQSGQHFGASLSMDDWVSYCAHFESFDIRFKLKPNINSAGTAKMMLYDPDGYQIELKAYPDMKAGPGIA